MEPLKFALGATCTTVGMMVRRNQRIMVNSAGVHRPTRSSRASSGVAAPFLAVSYNMFAESLGSNSIPWVIRISEEWKKRIVATPGIQHSWDGMKQILGSEYKTHFHKNTMSQSDPLAYKHMRKLWSVKKLEAPEDIPPELDLVRFVKPWTVEYTDRRTGKTHTATPLGGLLQKIIDPPNVGDGLFQHIMDEEQKIYTWGVRGPRIFRRVTSPWEDSFVSSAGKVTWGADTSPALICLQEYDVHNAKAVYNPAVGVETFYQAMRTRGYDGIFFQSSSKTSGVAIYWKEGVFSLDTASPSHPMPDSVALEGHYGNMVYNYDMKEHWHCYYGGSNGSEATSTLMPTLDRKNVGMVRLRHGATKGRLWVVGTHLMTESRDNKKLTKYPGEVRAQEIETLKHFIQRHARGGGSSSSAQDVLLLGDFNTDVGMSDIFQGRVKNAADPKKPPLMISTGYKIIEEGESTYSGPASRRACLAWLAGDKGADLYDAFESVHRRRPHEISKSSEHCTSQNAKRREWIDYIWHSCNSLIPVGVCTNTKRPNEPLPTVTEPSDHVPLGCLFSFSRL